MISGTGTHKASNRLLLCDYLTLPDKIPIYHSAISRKCVFKFQTSLPLPILPLTFVTNPSVNLAPFDVSYYTILGLTPLATSAEIRAAYRTLILLHHPDRTSARGEGANAASTSKNRNVQEGSELRYYRAEDINEAWEVLGDENKREAYDAERRKIKLGKSLERQKAREK